MLLRSFMMPTIVLCHCNHSTIRLSSVAVGGVREAWVRVWGARREAAAVRAALARLAAARARSPTLRLLPTALHVDMHPALTLQVSEILLYL